VHYTGKRRLIFLDRGEASFSVAHNSQRPFTVFAGGGTITAIGTQFDVRRDIDPTGRGEHVVVTVSNGTVEVGPPMTTVPVDIPDLVDVTTPKLSTAAGADSNQWAPARLVKGQELTYSSGGPQGKIERVNLEEVSAWREGRLEFRHTPFRALIPRVNRYSRKPIVLGDGDVGDLTYSGTVFEGQVQDWLNALQTLYPIEVAETPDSFVLRYIRERDQTGK
jgi:transmembrane sensor